MKIKRDQSKYKYLRDEWRKNNPNYSKEYYNKKKQDPEFVAKNIERSKRWQKENRDKAKINHLKYREKDRDHVNSLAKKSRIKTKDIRLKRRRESSKIRKEENKLFRLSENIRSLISSSFKRGNKNFRKTKKTEEILGCSIEDFINIILSKSPEGAKLEDFHQFGYHLDHIVPIASALTEEEVVKLNHYTNFQPLWWRDNISKSDKILELI